MLVEDLFAEYEKKAPVPMMLRGVLEHVLAPDRMNALFEDEAQRQYTRRLTFAMTVNLMCRIVTRAQPSVHSAYKKLKEELGVGERTVYDKINGMEPGVSTALVRTTVAELEVVLRTLGQVAPQPIPQYRLKIVDGNHFAATDRRLFGLRGGVSPLPGQALAVLDPALGLLIDLFPCEDGHAQERSLLPEVLKTVAPGDLWLEDRNFCTTAFLFGIHQRNAAFLVRQHGNFSRYELKGERISLGQTATGQVFEQEAWLHDGQGQQILGRRLTIELNTPTRDDEHELHLLTNVPAEVATGLQLAELYLQRWRIETAFAELTVPLSCEIKSLGSPKAAIFAFATAVVCYNAVQVLKGAIVAAQPPEPAAATEPHPAPQSEAASTDSPKSEPVAALPSNRKKPATSQPQRPLRDDLSMYYIANEVSRQWGGIDLMIPQSEWDRFANLTVGDLAERLRATVRHVQLSDFRKRKPNQRPSPRTSAKKTSLHVSTAKVMAGIPPKPKC